MNPTVGVKSSYRAVCGCSVIAPPPCQCLNGGTCLTNAWNGRRCNCPRGYQGNRCQRLILSLDGASSFAAFAPTLSCRNGVTSIDVRTTQTKSLVFYIGLYIIICRTEIILYLVLYVISKFETISSLDLPKFICEYIIFIYYFIRLQL